jgi:hypothetical protein
VKALPSFKLFKLYKDLDGDFCIIYGRGPYYENEWLYFCYTRSTRIDAGPKKWEQFSASSEIVKEHFRYTRSKLTPPAMHQLVDMIFGPDWDKVK